jgi:hypothetical protein
MAAEETERSVMSDRALGAAWWFGLVGLDKHTTLVVVAFLALNKLAVLWLAILCVIVWQWKKGLEKALPQV